MGREVSISVGLPSPFSHPPLEVHKGEDRVGSKRTTDVDIEGNEENGGEVRARGGLRNKMDPLFFSLLIASIFQGREKGGEGH